MVNSRACGSKVVDMALCWDAIRFLELKVEEVRSAKLQFSSMENGFEQSTVGAEILPRIS